MKHLVPDGELWIFLGDSLTEGIGTRRVSYVSELVGLLRARRARPVHSVRLRQVDLSGWKHLGHYNLVGHLDLDQSNNHEPLWLVNCAAESTTIETDRLMLAALSCLRPSHFIVLRGPLETVVRPTETIEKKWPVWIPNGWRHYAGLDPRCFFSSASVRRAKQVLVDTVKQRIRLRLLSKREGAPLLDDMAFLSAYDQVLSRMLETRAKVTVLALPPIDATVFPGTTERIERRNFLLRDLAARRGVNFVDWSPVFDRAPDLFCRDGFHPSERGAKAMAEHLLERLGTLVS